MPRKATEHTYRLSALPRAKERALVEAAKRGDARAREKLWLGCKNYAQQLAARVARASDIPQEDLLSEAAVGFLVALDRYDPDNPAKARFLSFAHFYMKLKVYEYGHKEGSLMHIGLALPADKKKRRQQRKRPASINDWSVSDYIDYYWSRRALSLHDLDADNVAEDGRTATNSDPEAIVSANERSNSLSPLFEEAMGCLGEDERTIIEQTVLHATPLSQAADSLGISYERARKMRASGERKLREALLARATPKELSLANAP